MAHQTCSSMRQQLPFLLHGELSEEKRGSVWNHLSQCPRCKSEYEKLHKTFELVQSVKREPENFNAFNQTLFRRIRFLRPDRTVVVKPIPVLFRPGVLVPVLSLCAVFLTIGVLRHQGSLQLAKEKSSLQELALLEELWEEAPELEGGNFVEEEIFLLDEMLLAEAVASPHEEALLKELELLEELGEGEEVVGEEGEADLEEELLFVDGEALG